MIFFWFTWPLGRIPTAQVNKRNIISSSHHNNPMRETIICQHPFLFFFCNNAHRILRVVALMWARARSTADFRVFSSMTDWLYLNRPQTIVVGSEHLTITWGLDIFRYDETNDLWGHRKCLKAREECAPPPVNTAVWGANVNRSNGSRAENTWLTWLWSILGEFSHLILVEAGMIFTAASL